MNQPPTDRETRVEIETEHIEVDLRTEPYGCSAIHLAPGLSHGAWTSVDLDAPIVVHMNRVSEIRRPFDRDDLPWIRELAWRRMAEILSPADWERLAQGLILIGAQEGKQEIRRDLKNILGL